MAGNDVTGVIDQDRVQPTELNNRSRNLRNLFLAVRASVARIGDQLIEWPSLDSSQDP
jgi:hypothetical protein